ncbi:dephospho-CoA kinase [Rossellomorea vietnamensis]|uniref:Dephospho-CoA kinase n=2 Tax=Rossellomorea TaxID=2837508 RepID=A0A5D4KJ84_9BACI|nr:MULTISPECIES: dephospho-CoA kinase [Rossellomorea]TYR76920.1 dephospho-CoA kinase [Rossellomorea vietnamensis]TYS84134.1 dephospho-CoA kinase [Rossellomorea aquimaris]
MTSIIGLTGGIASGKSTVSSLLAQKGFTVVDADLAARKVVEPGEPAYLKIVETFGQDILNKEGTLDRAALGSIIFHNEERRKELNGIVHPAVRAEMLAEKEKAFEDGKQTVVMDIPLLFESNLTWMVEKTVVVYVDRDTQLSRLMLRNGLTEEEAEARVNSQMSLDEKRNLADAILDNRGTISETGVQLDDLLGRWNLTP